MSMADGKLQIPLNLVFFCQKEKRRLGIDSHSIFFCIHVAVFLEGENGHSGEHTNTGRCEDSQGRLHRTMKADLSDKYISQ